MPIFVEHKHLKMYHFIAASNRKSLYLVLECMKTFIKELTEYCPKILFLLPSGRVPTKSPSPVMRDFLMVYL